MSLARNPEMPYVSAGRQDNPYQRLNVRSNVYVPDAEARADYDGRPAFTAPAAVRREPFRISIKPFVLVTGLALCVMCMLYLSALSRSAALVKSGQALLDEIQMLESEADVLRQQIAQAQEPNALRYTAAQLGMINSEGVTPEKIYAPDTRPAQADNTPFGGVSRAQSDP